MVTDEEIKNRLKKSTDRILEDSKDLEEASLEAKKFVVEKIISHWPNGFSYCETVLKFASTYYDHLSRVELLNETVDRQTFD